MRNRTVTTLLQRLFFKDASKEVAFSSNQYFKNYCIHVIPIMSRGDFSLEREGNKKIRKVLVTEEIPRGIDD